MNDYIPYSTQTISQDDIKNITKVLKSPFLTQGPLCKEFEELISSSVGSRGAVAFNSATSALHIACLSLGLKEGDLVWTVPNSFVASANCALYCGAEIDFVDIDPISYNVSIEKLEIKLNLAKKKNKLPKIFIPVHFAGQSCQMKEIYKLLKPFKIKIIEDASHAIGGQYNKTKIGCCKYSDICIFSFHPVKIITSGEGGMATSNNLKILEKMMELRAHGITRNLNKMKDPKNEKWYYEQLDLGFNYRLTEIHASLGITQYKRINIFLKKRNNLARRYYKELIDTNVQLPCINDDTYSAWHLYVIRVSSKNCKISRDKLFRFFHKKNIGVNVHYLPIHLHPYYRKIGFKAGDFPESEKYSEEALSIPIFPNLKKCQQDTVIKIIRDKT